MSLHFGSFLFLFTHQESYVLSRVHIPQGVLLTIDSSALRSSPFDSGTIDIFNAFGLDYCDFAIDLPGIVGQQKMVSLVQR